MYFYIECMDCDKTIQGDPGAVRDFIEDHGCKARR